MWPGDVARRARLTQHLLLTESFVIYVPGSSLPQEGQGDADHFKMTRPWVLSESLDEHARCLRV